MFTGILSQLSPAILFHSKTVRFKFNAHAQARRKSVIKYNSLPTPPSPKTLLTCDFNGCRLTFRLAPRRPRVTLALERCFAEVVVHHVLGDGGGYLLQMHTGARIDVRLDRGGGQRVRAAAASEGELCVCEDGGCQEGRA